MKKWISIAMCVCLAVSVMACSRHADRAEPEMPQSSSVSEAQKNISNPMTSSESASESKPAPEPETKPPIVTNLALASTGMKDALTDETVFGVKVYVNRPPETELSVKTVETLSLEDVSIYMCIVPRYVGSSITIEGMEFDEVRNEFVTTGLLFESVCTDDYILSLRADLPEAGPRIRITVTYQDMTASYEPLYDGKGDTVYPYVKNGVLLDEAPAFSKTPAQEMYETLLAEYGKDALVVDSAFTEVFDNIELLKAWINDYRQGKPGKVAVFIDGSGFPSHLYIFESDGDESYTISCYSSTSGKESPSSSPTQVFESSVIIERAYDYVFRADLPKDSESGSFIVHSRPVPKVEKMNWNPIGGKPIGQLTLEQAQEAARLINERISRYTSVIPSFYSGGLYLRQSVLDVAEPYSGPKLYYKVMGAVKIDGEPFYLVYGNQNAAELENGEHSGSVTAISGDGSLAFIQSMEDGSWIFVDDRNEKVIAPKSIG